MPVMEGANRMPLKKRLTDLLDLALGTGRGLVGEYAQLFVMEVEEVRNGYAHGRTSECGLRSDSGARHWAAESVKWLVRVALMLDLGFSDAEVARRVTSHPDFVFAGRRLREFLATESDAMSTGFAGDPEFGE
jgi:hypothetical protein